jgi:hypothetical protein
VDASNRRWYREGLGQPKNLRWFGGLPTSTDCTTAWNNMWATASTKSDRFYVPPGTYTFLSAPTTITYPAGQCSYTLEGAGADVTILNWPNATNGLSFAFSSSFHGLHVRDLTVSTSQAGGSMTAINVTNSVQGGSYAQNDFTRVTIRGADGGGATDYWTYGINIVGASNFNYIGCLFYGNSTSNGSNGLLVAGNASGSFKYSLVHNLESCGFYHLGVGFTYGTYVQGVAMNKCNFTNGSTDIFVPSSAVDMAQLSINNSQFAGLTGAVNDRIIFSGAVAAVQINNSLFFINAGSIGISFNGVWGQVTITGNIFSGVSNSTNFGINVANTGFDAIATNNVFYNLTNGIDLVGASTGGWNVQANNYGGTTNTVLNIGSNSVGTATQ